MTRRLSINCDDSLLAHVNKLTAAHAPFVTRHRLLRAALRYGVDALCDGDDKELAKMLRNDRDATVKGAAPRV